MASVLAIISKAIYEKEARRPDRSTAGVGDVLPMDRYMSANKGLAPLTQGGTLFLVTVRPPDEQLLLVAALKDPRFVKDHWEAKPNVLPQTDVTSLLPGIKLASGTGIAAKPGRLGMSLQTPRVLCDADVKLLLAAAAGTAVAPAPPATVTQPRSRREALVADVIAAPDEDAPRLVLADWLMEQNEPRGEFVAGQVRLASRQIFRSLRLDIRHRVQELKAQHEKQWTDFGVKGAEWRFHRGFIIEVKARAAGLLKVADDLFASEPVQRLTLRECTMAHLKALSRAPWLERIVALKLAGELDDEGADLLSGMKGLRNLRLLNLYGCGITEEGASALARSPTLCALRTLTLTENAIGDDGVTALAGSSILDQMEKLYLGRTEVGDQGVRALASSVHLSRLRELGLGGNDVSDASARVLGSSPNLPRLWWLELDVGHKARNELKKRFPRLR